jgi:hypothetical protein
MSEMKIILLMNDSQNNPLDRLIVSSMSVTRDISGFWNRFEEPGVSMDSEIRIVRILDTVGRYRSEELSCLETTDVLGMSERHFRRRRDRYEAEWAKCLVDRRLGRASVRRAPGDRIDWVLALYTRLGRVRYLWGPRMSRRSSQRDWKASRFEHFVSRDNNGIRHPLDSSIYGSLRRWVDRMEACARMPFRSALRNRYVSSRGLARSLRPVGATAAEPPSPIHKCLRHAYEPASARN